MSREQPNYDEIACEYDERQSQALERIASAVEKILCHIDRVAVAQARDEKLRKRRTRSRKAAK